MPDMLIRGIDATIAERIQRLAGAWCWPPDELVLKALRHGLDALDMGAIEQLKSPAADQDLVLSGHWSALERTAFNDALTALRAARKTATGLDIT